MKFINTDGLAFIGPGSEWFWAAVSGLVLAVTFFAIYRQLRLQRDAAATEQLSGLLSEWSSERMCRAKLTILLAIQAGVESDQLPNRAVSHIGYFWQRIGYLVKTGHMDRQIVHEHLGPQVQMWRAWLGSDDFEAFGWLARASAAMDVKAGESGWLDATFLADQLPEEHHPLRRSDRARGVPQNLDGAAEPDADPCDPRSPGWAISRPGA